MALPPSSPVVTNYTQPQVTNSAQRDTITITADGKTTVLVQRRDAAGNILENVMLTVPQAGGNVTDSDGRIYGTVADGTFTSAVATICAQVDSAVAAYAAAGKFDR